MHVHVHVYVVYVSRWHMVRYFEVVDIEFLLFKIEC